MDLETDRGRPTRASSLLTSPSSGKSLPMSQLSAALQEGAQILQREAAAARAATLGPLDSISEQDHLADLVEYPLGSLSSFEGLDETPDWIEQMAQPSTLAAAAVAASREELLQQARAELLQQQLALLKMQQQQQLQGSGGDEVGEGASSSGTSGATASRSGLLGEAEALFTQPPRQQQQQQAVMFMEQSQQQEGELQPSGVSQAQQQQQQDFEFVPWDRDSSSSSSSSSGSPMRDGSIRALHAIEDQLIEEDKDYKPFCEKMYAELGHEDPDKGARPHPAVAARLAQGQGGGAAAGAAAAAPAGVPATARGFPNMYSKPAPPGLDGDEEEELRRLNGYSSKGSTQEYMKSFYDIEDQLNSGATYKPFCEAMYEELHGKDKKKELRMQRQQQGQGQGLGSGVSSSSRERLADMEGDALNGNESGDEAKRANAG